MIWPLHGSGLLRAGALEVALRVGVVVREKLSFPVNYSVSACFVLFYFIFFFWEYEKNLSWI